MSRHDNILGTIGNTPAGRIDGLAPAGINLFARIESFDPLGPVKDRLALGVSEAAEKSGGCSETFDALKTGELRQKLTASGVSFDPGSTADPHEFMPGWL